MTEGIELLYQEKIRTLGEMETYKYSGILKANTIKHTEMKENTVELKEIEKRDKYLDLARELTKLSNMNVTVIPIVIDALSKVSKGLVQGLEDLEIRGQMETIQTTGLLRSIRIPIDL